MISTFDHVEDPMPNNQNDDIMFLYNCDSKSQKVMQNIISELNSDKMLERTDYRWYLERFHTGWYTNWYHRVMVMRLADRKQTFIDALDVRRVEAGNRERNPRRGGRGGMRFYM